MVNTRFKYKIKEVARKHNLPESAVEDMFNSQFKFYREKVELLPVVETETEEEFNKLKSIFYFKYIGKFFINWRKAEHVKKNLILKQKLNGED